MTPAEMFRVQGFTPECLEAVSSRTAMAQLAGNSMAVPVVTHLFETLLPLLFPELVPEVSSSSFSESTSSNEDS